MTGDWTTSGPDLHLALASLGPRHAALEDALRDAIREGRLSAGTRLPSTRTLAGDLGLSRGTVVEAFAQLSAEGYLEARHGAGTGRGPLAAVHLSRASSGDAHARAPLQLQPGESDLTSPPGGLDERAAAGAARPLRDVPRLRRPARAR